VTALSLRRLWTIYKRTAIGQGQQQSPKYTSGEVGMVKIYEGDYEYEEAGNVPAPSASITPKSEELKEVSESFRRNFFRVLALHHFVLDVAGLSYMIGSAQRRAYMELNHEPNRQLPPELKDQFHFKTSNDIREQLNYHDKRLGDFLKRVGISGLKRIDEQFVPRLQSPEEPSFRMGIESMLAAVLIGAWTAFESFLEDLWIVAVNARPAQLAKAVMEKRSTESRQEREQQEKTITFDVLQRYGFDLRKSMGTLFVDSQKVNFKKFEGAKKAYAAAFEEKIEPALATHSGVPVTEALRNVFVHKGGVVDSLFASRVKNDPTFNKLKTGEYIRLTGPLIRDRVTELAACALAVLEAVDEFLDNNK
jgi:hypothetical protein